jgi:hypothetical protein
MFSSKRVVFLLGAGATLSDVASRPDKHRPPLDKGFFRAARSTQSSQVELINKYMATVYGVDVCQPEADSLEQVMAQVYTDTFTPALEESAAETFRDLIRLFNRRLATKTNNVPATNKRFVYRMIAHYLADEHVAPDRLTIVTFNQDIQVERTLRLMSTVDRWRPLADRIFNFPHCYGLIHETISSPPESVAAFPLSAGPTECIRVLKLHGSLNWFSAHRSATPTPRQMFREDRRLWVYAPHYDRYNDAPQPNQRTITHVSDHRPARHSQVGRPSPRDQAAMGCGISGARRSR